MIVINILLITFVVVYVIDFSGFLLDASRMIWELTHPKQIWKYKMLGKPIGCSVCMSFWICSIYLLCAGYSIVISLSVGCLMALSTNIFKLIINFYNKLTIK